MSTKAIFQAVFLASAAVLILMPAIGAGPTFVPDSTFKGSSLTGWHPLGEAAWRAENGEIVGTPKSAAGGWLLLDKQLQDSGFYASFKCAGGCKTGILIRGEKTPEGMKGLLVSLVEGDLGLFKITLDANGQETHRDRLRAGGSMARFAPPATPPGGAGGRGAGGAGRGPAAGSGDAPGAAPGGGAGAAGGRGAGGGGGRGPSQPVYHANDWNTVQVIIDADILRGALNSAAGGLGAGATDDQSAGFGSIGFYVGGSGEVRFKDVAYKDLGIKEEPAEQISSHFRVQRLDEYFYSWGVGAADINHDGVTDIAAGPYYYLGPDYTKRREIYAAATYNPSTVYPDTWLEFAADFTGDGWPDMITTGLGQTSVLYVNPKGEARRWDKYVVTPQSNTEISLMKDIDGDGQQDVILGLGTVACWATPNPANPTGPWTIHRVSGPGAVANHGLGVGDVNGDKLPDIVTPNGWYEQPARGTTQELWTFHQETFASRGGAEMGVYDVNGDGLTDVVAAQDAHGFGLVWNEQKRDKDGKSSFVQHVIMEDLAGKNAGGVAFSELHGSTVGDVDGDGVPDFIVGKRYWSHKDSYTDPDPHGPPVLYYYRTVRNKNAPGGAEFVPELIHNRSGAGSQVLAQDLNGDGALDVEVSTNRGTFIFWGNQRKRK